MKVVFDTNVLISATMWDNSIAHRLFIKLIKENAEIVTSVDILEEYKKVLIRDFKYNEGDIKYIITTLLSLLKIIKPTIKVDVIKEDPDDNKILECAISSNSEIILSYDNHLLKLKKFKDIKIIRPEEFLENV